MLLAMTAVGVAMLVMLLWFVVALVLRRRFQFSIRSLLVLVVAIALPCSSFVAEMKAARRQQAAVDAILQLGGIVEYDWRVDGLGGYIENARPPGPPWLRNLLGADFLSHVVYLGFPSRQVTDDSLVHLEAFPQLQGLSLAHNPVTDAGLERLTGLSDLRLLFLDSTRVSDAGVKKLQRALPNCEITH